ncbi:MAG: hypothetical protein ABIJ59_10500 [Pseudomonadota bacterium]
MVLVILSIVGAVILLDVTLIGFIPEKFGIWGSLKKEVQEKLIEDTVQYSISTDITGKYINSMINNRVGYKSLILTPEALIVKNTRMTYLLKIDISKIASYEVKNELIGKRFKLNLKIQETKRLFEFSTNNYKRWVKEFSKLNISEKTQG